MTFYCYWFYWVHIYEILTCDSNEIKVRQPILPSHEEIVSHLNIFCRLIATGCCTLIKYPYTNDKKNLPFSLVFLIELCLKFLLYLHWRYLFLRYYLQHYVSLPKSFPNLEPFDRFKLNLLYNPYQPIKSKRLVRIKPKILSFRIEKKGESSMNFFHLMLSPDSILKINSNP